MGEQFTYSTQYNAEQGITAHWVTFRQAFALQIFVVEDLSQLPEGAEYDDDKFIRPGWVLA